MDGVAIVENMLWAPVSWWEVIIKVYVNSFALPRLHVFLDWGGFWLTACAFHFLVTGALLLRFSQVLDIRTICCEFLNWVLFSLSLFVCLSWGQWNIWWANKTLIYWPCGLTRSTGKQGYVEDFLGGSGGGSTHILYFVLTRKAVVSLCKKGPNMSHLTVIILYL